MLPSGLQTAFQTRISLLVFFLVLMNAHTIICSTNMFLKLHACVCHGDSPAHAKAPLQEGVRGDTTTGQGRAFGCRAGVERGIHNDAKGVAAGATFHSCVNLCVYICRHACKGGKARRAPVCAQRVFGLTPGCFCRSATCLSVCRSASVKDASKVLVLRTGLGSLSTVICLVPNDYGASGGIEVCRLLLPVFGCSP